MKQYQVSKDADYSICGILAEDKTVEITIVIGSKDVDREEIKADLSSLIFEISMHGKKVDEGNYSKYNFVVNTENHSITLNISEFDAWDDDFDEMTTEFLFHFGREYSSLQDGEEVRL